MTSKSTSYAVIPFVADPDTLEAFGIDVAEARALFPTPEPGRASPDSTVTVFMDTAEESGVRSASPEEDASGVEGGTAARGEEEDGPTTTTTNTDCRCDDNGGEYCHCAERCDQDPSAECSFRRIDRRCRTHGVRCLACHDLIDECQCEPLQVRNHAERRANLARSRGRGSWRASAEEEDDEDSTAASVSTTEDEEAAPHIQVEARGRRSDTPVAERRSRFPPMHPRATAPDGSRSSAIPADFWENVPPRHLPFRITEGGRDVEARYVTIYMEDDPIALGFARPGGPIYYRQAQAAPRITDQEANSGWGYTLNDLFALHPDYLGRAWVDNALVRTKDDGLRAEVHRYRCLTNEQARSSREVERLQNRLHDIQLEVHACIKRLARAEAVERVEEHRGAGVRMVSPWSFERGRSS
jgi:hypothetical protein